jgi:bis(5'-nucleosyl)-tetraphosphatase (symmetrical)
MAVWAIGDVQGCYDELCRLLEKVRFSGADQIWFVGDLINRGPSSLEVLRLVKSLANGAVSVLGNHDLHWLAIHYGGHKARRGDTFDALAAASDVDELSDWLRRLPLVHHDPSLRLTMVHAGVYPRWSVTRLRMLAEEVNAVLRSEEAPDFFKQLYGNDPSVWTDELDGMKRLRFITNTCTRMRLLDQQDELDFEHKEDLAVAPAHLRPWFEVYAERFPGERVVFGHWASLDGVTGRKDLIGLDTGCVWGRTLTAMNLESMQRVEVAAVTGRAVS